jgi:hypothetical protein
MSPDTDGGHRRRRRDLPPRPPPSFHRPELGQVMDLDVTPTKPTEHAIAILTSVNPARRGVRAFQRRYPRAFLTLGVLAFAAFAAWQADRVWTSPIRGTVAFDTGLILCLGIGLFATACWIVTLYRKPSNGRWAWWQWTSAIVWLTAMVVTGPRDRAGRVPPLAPTNAFIVGALSYVIAAFVGSGFALAVVLVRRATATDS